MTADTTADTKIRDALARVEAGLKCVTRQGDYTSMIDMPAAMGGDGSAPSPGFLGRSAIAGCLAIGSRDPKMFTPDMDSLFVTYIAEVLSRVVQRLGSL